MSFSLVQRLLQSLSPRSMPFSASMRVEVRPPGLRQRTPSWSRRFGAWLTSGSAESSVWPGGHEPKPSHRKEGDLEDARIAFRAALVDISSLAADSCRMTIGAARSRQELWHLRSVVFHLVSCRLSQGEADRRLVVLDQFFARRSRRPGGRSMTSKEGGESTPPPL
jgi:hypothetical protein